MFSSGVWEAVNTVLLLINFCNDIGSGQERDALPKSRSCGFEVEFTTLLYTIEFKLLPFSLKFRMVLFGERVFNKRVFLSLVKNC